MLTKLVANKRASQQTHHSSLRHTTHSTASPSSETTATTHHAIAVALVASLIVLLLLLLAHLLLVPSSSTVVVGELLFVQVHLLAELSCVVGAGGWSVRVFPLSLSGRSVDVKEVLTLRIVLAQPTSEREKRCPSAPGLHVQKKVRGSRFHWQSLITSLWASRRIVGLGE